MRYIPTEHTYRHKRTTYPVFKDGNRGYCIITPKYVKYIRPKTERNNSLRLSCKNMGAQYHERKQQQANRNTMKRYEA